MVGVAQLVERRIVIPVVVGSNPIVHPIFPLADSNGLGLPVPPEPALNVGAEIPGRKRRLLSDNAVNSEIYRSFAVYTMRLE